MKKILVIEDETILRENIVALLEAEDFEVIAAENGLVGLKMAISELPDVILCDMMMPELDGYGVLTMLRQEPTTTTTPFIFLTARSTKSDFRQGMELGADDYLTKPFTRAELLKAIAIRLTKQATFKKHLSVETLDVTPREQAITIGLRQALQNQEFEIHYQPQVDLQTGLIFGAESLLRWHHPDLGMVSPAEFIPVAESTGLIIPVGKWVLDTACRQTKIWHDAGFNSLYISVNLSARQFTQPDLSQKIVDTLDSTNLAPRMLKLELTESIIMQDVHNAIAIMKELQAIGVEIAIDDFGTGYSSLNYLKNFPVDILKIDRCFVRNLDQDAKNSAITTAMIHMAHDLNLRVIAEGVETEAELFSLCQQRCDAMQGFFFSRPLPVAEFEKLLIANKRLPIPTAVI